MTHRPSVQQLQRALKARRLAHENIARRVVDMMLMSPRERRRLSEFEQQLFADAQSVRAALAVGAPIPARHRRDVETFQRYIVAELKRRAKDLSPENRAILSGLFERYDRSQR